MPPPPAAAKAELRQLQFRLVATRARLLLTRAGAAFALAATIAIGGLAAEMTLDWLVHLPWLARACFSLPAIGAALWLLYRLALLPLLRIPSDHAVACEIERAMPVFQTRLIASIQLGRDDVAKKNALVGALIRETAAIAAGQDFRKAVKYAHLIRRVRILACVLVAAGALAILARGNLTILFQRALLLTTRLPTRTRIESIQSPAKLASGGDLAIEVQAAGIIPAEGRIITHSGSAAGEYKLERVPGASRFHAVIHSLSESLTFRALLGDATSDSIPVTVLSPPALLALACLELFPAYTRLPPAIHPTGDLSLLAGSTLHLTLTSSGPVRDGSVHLAGLDKELPLSIDPKNRTQPSADIPIPAQGLTGFSLRLVDDNGIPSRETALYRIDIIPDRPPAIKITHPEADESATPAATEVIGFQADDDFGVATLLLHYIVNHAGEKVILLDLAGSTPRHLVRRFDWNLASLKLAPGGQIEYWMEAQDANNVTGPGKTLTDHARIKIVTESEKRTELAERTNDALSSLDQVGQSEDDLARALGTLIFQTPDAGNP